MLDSISNMELNYLKTEFLARKSQDFAIFYAVLYSHGI